MSYQKIVFPDNRFSSEQNFKKKIEKLNAKNKYWSEIQYPNTDKPKLIHPSHQLLKTETKQKGDMAIAEYHIRHLKNLIKKGVSKYE